MSEIVKMDYILRAQADHGRVRAFAASTREMVETARRKHDTTPVVTAALGRLLTAGAMMGLTMQDDDLLTIQIRSDGPIEGLTVTADAAGHVKGYPLVPNVVLPLRESDNKLDVAQAIGHGSLYVSKDLGLKEPYMSEVGLISGEIAEDLSYYYSQSEQTPSAVGLGVFVSKENIVSAAGGFLVQLMPGAPDSTIDKLEANLKGITSVTDILRAGGTPEDILDTLLKGMEPEILDRCGTSFKCDCSVSRIEKALVSVGKEELEQMISENKDIEMRCSFCNKKYIVSPQKIKELYNEAINKNK